MLQAPVQPSNYSLRDRRAKTASPLETNDLPLDMDDDYDEEPDSKGRSKSRRELPAGAVATLKAWLLSPEHFTHPYPTPQDQAMLMEKTGIDKKQLKNWFTNARRRIWKPMLKKQIEQGKLTAGGPAGAVPGLMSIPGVPNVGTSMDNPHSIQAMRVHYQQAVQQQVRSIGRIETAFDCLETHCPQMPDTYSSAPSYMSESVPAPSDTYYSGPGKEGQIAPSSSIGTLPALSSNNTLSKTDSHAVLMELFARDQDLVRQATESARLKAEQKQQPAIQYQSTQQANQHPMNKSSMPTVPTLNSWPHFSSITSLNNLGTIPGVKSITSLSGADLASKGSMNKMGNLAQVKSMESMGKNDSYAFLEVFFGDRSATNLSGMGGGRDNKSLKGSADAEDSEIGLSLDDESPSQTTGKKEFQSPQSAGSMHVTMSTPQEGEGSGTLKRAYDDAVAARGLISVSRSCEKLTDLPAKMQRTLSQDFLSKQVQPPQQYSSYEAPAHTLSPNNTSQYAGQHPGEPQAQGQQASKGTSQIPVGSELVDGHVQVPTATVCALCNQTNVDTQLRPCGHMFHERCLKPSLQTPLGPPKCPIDRVLMQSALLAVPTDEPATSNQASSWHFSGSVARNTGSS